MGAGTANVTALSKMPAKKTESTAAQTAPSRPDPTNPFNSLTGNAQHQPKQQLATAVAGPPENKQQNMIDFFASIESEQTSMFPGPQQQQQFTSSMPLYSDTTFVQSFQQPQPQSVSQQFAPTSSTNPFPATTTTQPFFTGQSSFSPSFSPQSQFTSPQQPIRPEWTGAGFGGYTPSSAGSPVTILPTIPSGPATQQPYQQSMQQSAPPVQPSMQSGGLQVDRNSTGTNPFRASMLPTQQSTGQSSQGTNPFSTGQRTQTISPSLSQAPSFSSQTSYSSIPQPLQQQQQQQPFQPSFSTSSQSAFQPPQSPVFQSTQPVFQPQPQQSSTFPSQSQPTFQVPSTTGTNPFSRPKPSLQPTRLTPQVTGSNPFRQSTLPPPTNNTNGFSWTPTQ